jgi:hypothetical protein
MLKGLQDQYQHLSHYREKTCGLDMPLSPEASGYLLSMYLQLGLVDSGQLGIQHIQVMTATLEPIGWFRIHTASVISSTQS